MENKTRKAIVKKTSQEVEVYKLKRGGWCNAKNCTTEYQEHELEFKN